MFDYSEMDIDRVGTVEVFDFYYDFEEVITHTPEGDTYPAVGDTIRVSDGHFRQVISLYNNDLKHIFLSFFLPQ